MPEITMKGQVRRVPERPRTSALGDPLVLAIATLTLAGLGLRLIYLVHNGFLLGVAEYDDGPYFGSAVRLTQGVLPYRDFVLVQPPGITLLMVPSALLAKVAGTAAGLVTGRILTVLAGTASVPLVGLIVRHRGPRATVVACGLTAVYPDAVAAAHTVLLEPWLVLFILAGVVLMFDGDHLTTDWRRIAWAGVAVGFAGAVKAWAVVPAVILLAACLMSPLPGQSPLRRRTARARLNRAMAFAAGLAGGFLVPVAPFAVASPSGFYQDIVAALSGALRGVGRVGLLDRAYELAGLSDLSVSANSQFAQASSPFIHLSRPLTTAVVVVAVILILAVAGGPMLLVLASDHGLTGLEWFALASTWLVTAIFLWPNEFYYHFAAFLAPFLALAIALPLTRVISPASTTRRSGRDWVTGAVALLVVIFAVVQARAEIELQPSVPPGAIAAAGRLIPPGSCATSDTVTLLLLADRFSSSAPGCTVVLDGLGSDLALSHGLTPTTGAGAVPSVGRLWRRSIHHAQFLWLSRGFALRIPITTALSRYIHHHFQLIYADHYGDTLYKRRGPVRHGR